MLVLLWLGLPHPSRTLTLSLLGVLTYQQILLFSRATTHTVVTLALALALRPTTYTNTK